jgi:hypothetical protein
MIARVNVSYRVDLEGFENLVAVMPFYAPGMDNETAMTFGRIFRKTKNSTGCCWYVGREASSTPATGFHNRFRQQQETLLQAAFGAD